MAEPWVETHVIVNDETIARANVLEIIDPVWWTANFYNDKAAYDRSLKQFSAAQKFVWAVSWYQAEVFNGGHDQFFDNSTGMVWADALDGLETMSAAPVKAVLADAVARLDGQPAFDRRERQGQLSSFYESGGSFDDLDDRFYALPQSFDLEASVLAYIRARPQAFHFDAIVKRSPRRT